MKQQLLIAFVSLKCSSHLAAQTLARMNAEDMLTEEERASQHDKEVQDYEHHRLDHNIPPQVASMEDQVNITCRNCGSKRVSTLRRNAVEDNDQAILEVTCHQCGSTAVHQD